MRRRRRRGGCGREGEGGDNSAAAEEQERNEGGEGMSSGRREGGREGRGEVAMANGCGVRAWRRAIKFRARTTHSRLGSKGEAL